MNARLSDGASSFHQLRDQLRALSAAPLAPIPGSDSPLELAALLRDPPLFFLERFARYGHVFKSRLVFPVVFLVGGSRWCSSSAPRPTGPCS